MGQPSLATSLSCEQRNEAIKVSEWEHWAYKYDFYQAIMRGDIPEVRRFVQLGVDPNRPLFDLKENPLGFTIERGDVAMVQALLECGVDPDQRDYEGRTAVQCAVWSEHERHAEALMVLLAHGSPEAREPRAVQALHVAAGQGAANLVFRLLDAGVDIDAPDAEGFSPLMSAIGHFAELRSDPESRKAVVSLLLEQGADVNFATTSGYCEGLTALHCAASQGDTDLVICLQERGAQITLPIAAMLGDEETVSSLLAAGEAPDNQDCEGNTALHNAVERGYAEIARLLLEHGADAQLPSCCDETPLSIAASAGHTEVVRTLLHYGAGEQKTEEALYQAARGGHLDTAIVLLESGWNVNGIIEDQLTPLMGAAAGNFPDMIRLLVAQGAEVNFTNSDGNTARVIR
jgi:ankyrin repeat protein